MLTTEQRNHYETFGFILFRGLFSAEEMNDIGKNFDDVIDEARGGKPFEGERRQMVLGCIEKRPVLARLVEDDRIHGAIESLLGPDFIWLTSDGNYYVGDTQWHPDAGNHLFG